MNLKIVETSVGLPHETVEKLLYENDTPRIRSAFLSLRRQLFLARTAKGLDNVRVCPKDPFISESDYVWLKSFHKAIAMIDF